MRVAIGQDSHRFIQEKGGMDNTSRADVACHAGYTERNDSEHTEKTLILGGVVFEGDCPPLDGNSDADVVLHALCNAISGITTVNILGGAADSMLREDGVTDSSLYVKEALKYLNGKRIVHISFSIECKKPAISPMIPAIRKRISEITDVPASSIGITATTGEGLTDFGKGLGIQVFCVVTAD
jgi:2-C-methyl-D-erythritol 2,4-cyclodiphosphate synthase